MAAWGKPRGALRHLQLAGAGGPVLVPGESFESPIRVELSVVADRRGRLIVTDTRGGQLLVFDTAPEPRLAARPATGRVFVTGTADGTVQVVEP